MQRDLASFQSTSEANAWLNADTHRTLTGGGSHHIDEPIKLLTDGAHFDGRNCRLSSSTGNFIQHGGPGSIPSHTLATHWHGAVYGSRTSSAPDRDSVGVWHHSGLNNRTLDWSLMGCQRVIRVGSADGWGAVNGRIEGGGNCVLSDQACADAATPIEIFNSTGLVISEIAVRGRADSTGMSLLRMNPATATDPAAVHYGRRPHIDTLFITRVAMQSMDNADKSGTGASVGVDMRPDDGAINHVFFNQCIFDHTTQIGWRILSRENAAGQIRGIKMTDVRMDVDSGVPIVFRNRSGNPVEDINIAGGTFVVPDAKFAQFRGAGFVNIDINDVTCKTRAFSSTEYELPGGVPEIEFADGALRSEVRLSAMRAYVWDGS